MLSAQIPYRPQTEREVSAWYRHEPEEREALQLAWLQLLPLARATEKQRVRR